MSNEYISVAIIDDGINEKRYNTGELKWNIEINLDLSMIQRIEYDPYQPSHGTTCAAIIKKYAPHVDLVSIKICNSTTNTSMKEQLVEAIRYCAENKIKVISLSIGTIYFKDFSIIKAVVDFAFCKGVIIIAACDNRDIITYPASLPNVIGVKCDKYSLLSEGDYVYNDFMPDGVEITACGKHSLMRHDGENKNIEYPSNSFATPLITAIAANILVQQPYATFEVIKRELKRKSCHKQKIKDDTLVAFLDECKVEKDIPVIIILDQSENNPGCFLKELLELFRRDDYNAVAITDRIGESQASYPIIHIDAYRGSGIYVDSLSILKRVYEPDIILVGLGEHTNYCIEQSDIYIRIINEFIYCVKSTNINESTQKQAGIKVDINNLSVENENMRTFINNGKTTIYELYRYIINLFENDP